MALRCQFARYASDRREACLALFDANCPEFFAPNERVDYGAFLDRVDAAYDVCLVDGAVVGAFGVIDEGAPRRCRLNWILIHPSRQGAGIGRSIMDETVLRARALGAAFVDIAASHRSASFFERFGARALGRTEDGWGPGMHRVDMELALSPRS